jgi:SAM-dependent methyltransferase
VSANYAFMLDRAVGLAGLNARILDFGCGTGAIVSMGRGRSLDIVGADTFDGHYAGWLEHVEPQARAHVARYENRLPYEDGSFDVVISNQVFEHVPAAALRDVLSDIARVLRAGGSLLASFPVHETWYEGHVGLFFAHRLKRWPTLRHRYMAVSHRLGLGLYRSADAETWARTSAATLDQACHFHRKAHIEAAIQDVFGAPADSIAAAQFDAHIARMRLGRAGKLLDNAAGARLKEAVMHVRSGVALQVRKA